MSVGTYKIITAQTAAQILSTGQPLTASYVQGKLSLAVGENWENEVLIDSCVIEDFEGSVTQFKQVVKLTNCHFKNCAFTFAYFLGGLVIERCTFDHYLDFQAGGHNQPGYRVLIHQNTFCGFVNHFDCWYKGEVSVCDNNFRQGTNIASQHQLLTFDVPLVITNNKGPVAIEAESAAHE
jgi:hypothetical protein